VSRARLWLMVLGPAPIVAGSIALSNYARSDPAAPLAMNDVLAHHSPRESEVQLVHYVEEDQAAASKLAAACAARAKTIDAQLGDKCAVIAAAPFVIAGDMSEAELRDWYDRTIHPAAAAMGHRYFTRRPAEPITVLLFSSKESYEHYSEKLYRDKGISIYGYYKPRERTLVMNIATGGGTLVHELTHALVAFDCPGVPDWFNEGLASLHEQCRFRDDEGGPWVEGLVNWRLPRLQKELEARRVPSLETFIRDDDFRGEREAINYAQARYFCMFMQHRGVLETFYTTLRKNIVNDPHGERAVKAAFPDLTWNELDAEFHAYVRDLQPR
jgi:hypothetical protein